MHEPTTLWRPTMIDLANGNKERTARPDALRERRSRLQACLVFGSISPAATRARSAFRASRTRRHFTRTAAPREMVLPFGCPEREGVSVKAPACLELANEAGGRFLHQLARQMDGLSTESAN